MKRSKIPLQTSEPSGDDSEAPAPIRADEKDAKALSHPIADDAAPADVQSEVSEEEQLQRAAELLGDLDLDESHGTTVVSGVGDLEEANRRERLEREHADRERLTAERASPDPELTSDDEASIDEAIEADKTLAIKRAVAIESDDLTADEIEEVIAAVAASTVAGGALLSLVANCSEHTSALWGSSDSDPNQVRRWTKRRDLYRFQAACRIEGDRQKVKASTPLAAAITKFKLKTSLPYKKGVPVAWLAKKGLPLDLLPDDFASLPFDRRERMMREAGAVATQLKQIGKSDAFIAKWDLPDDYYSRPRPERMRLYNAARQKRHRDNLESRAKAAEPFDWPSGPAVTSEEVERRTKALDAYLALDGRPQSRLRRERNGILGGWLELARFRELNGYDPTITEFSKLRKIGRKSAERLVRRIRDLEKPGMPWGSKL